MLFKKNIALLFSFSFFSLCLFGQSASDQGYVVLLNGDTLQGTINYRETAKNPNSFTFQSQQGGSKNTFRPGEVKRFFSNGNYYVSASVKIEVSPTKVDQLEKRKTLIFEEVTVFLRALIVGDKSLYYYQDDNGHENFYIPENDQFVLLEYKRYAKQENGRSVVGEVRKYSGQLTLYLSDCPEVISILKSVEYRISPLQKAFSRYYECVQGDVIFQRKTEKAKLEFGVLAGVSLTRLVPYKNGVPELTRAEFQESTNFVAGISVEIVLSKKLKQLSFPFELVYTSFAIQGLHTDIEDEFAFDYQVLDFKYTFLKVNNLVRFNIPIGKASIYLNAGMSNGIVLKKSSSLQGYIVVNGVEQQTDRLDELYIRNFEQGVVAGAGASFSRVSLEVRAERGNGLYTVRALGLATNRYYALLAYRF